MKAKHSIPILASATCILIFIAVRFTFTNDINIEHAHEQGTRLSVTHLLPDEEIVVSTLFEHRSAHGREYRIRRIDHQLIVTIFDTTPAWSRDDKEGNTKLLFIRPLSKPEIDGLSETIAYYREIREETSSARRHTKIRYFKAGKEIGYEFYLGFSLPEQLTWYDSKGMRNNPNFSNDYYRLATEYGVPPERVLKMISFGMLEKEYPNQ
ncbi:MAG: hypothetical protein R3F03_12000 [Opitutaceae bacterium]